ncbi:RWD-domain-containing protein [Thelephora ganbajun]|uniref:RWD-domain-containing protein n=1 Tax=Thelephora ganbajun TaxID=370292 RepID=A0ACB6ZU42_THEGA|nr:RWD-domain-containing protein [Thelephora ganbajun]
MSSDVLLEEFEVLESIYPTELTKISDTEIRIEVEPEDIQEGQESVKLILNVKYTSGYPDTLPELTAEPLEGEMEEEELVDLLNGLKTLGGENVGMAMTFTLVSHLREHLAELVRSRAEKVRKLAAENERLELEAEEAKTRGTPVTRESFLTWKVKFDKEMAAKRAKEQEEKLRNLTPKEREEHKKLQGRLTGKQIFERSRDWAEDESLEEGGISVDVTQYERVHQGEEENEGDRVYFSDSD